MATFIELHAPFAVRCESDRQVARGVAGRILHGQSAPVAILIAAAHAVRARLGPDVGRVLSGGMIDDAAQVDLVRGALVAALPASLWVHLRPSLEWYGCRGAAFHNDAHYADVLFGAWCIDGPTREIVFPRVATRVTATTGDWVVFDPFEPHAVLIPGRDRYRGDDYNAGDAVSVFLAFELDLAQPLREIFSIGAVAEHAQLLASRVPIHAETGAIS